jgi:hypothetical protein
LHGFCIMMLLSGVLCRNHGFGMCSTPVKRTRLVAFQHPIVITIFRVFNPADGRSSVRSLMNGVPILGKLGRTRAFFACYTRCSCHVCISSVMFPWRFMFIFSVIFFKKRDIVPEYSLSRRLRQCACRAIINEIKVPKTKYDLL